MSVILSDQLQIAVIAEVLQANKSVVIASQVHNALCKAQAIHLMQYLLAPCEKHIYKKCAVCGESDCVSAVEQRHVHRKDCPECIAEVKRELGID